MSDLYTPGGWISTGVGWLIGLFSGLTKETKNAINSLGLRLVDLGQGIVAAFVKTGRFLKAFGDLFRKLWTNIIRPFLAWALKNIELLKRKLREWFGPIVDWLLRVRKYVLDIYNKWVRPVLDTIDILRRGLRVLGSLGVDWAKQLDAKLGVIEQKIEQPFTMLLQKINEVIGWVDRIITADGLFQRLTLLQSLFKFRGEVINFQINTVVRPLTPAQQQRLNEPMGTYASEEQISLFVDLAQGGGGKTDAVIREWSGDLVRILTTQVPGYVAAG